MVYEDKGRTDEGSTNKKTLMRQIRQIRQIREAIKYVILKGSWNKVKKSRNIIYIF